MSEHNPPADHALDEDQESGNPIEQNVKSGATWLRGLFMLICCALISVAFLAGSLIVGLGFFWVLFTGEVNRQIQQAGQSLASYMYNIARYLTFNTDEKPFPLGGEWPTSETTE
jgi:Flp pilus assembly protein TadB